MKDYKSTVEKYKSMNKEERLYFLLNYWKIEECLRPDNTFQLVGTYEKAAYKDKNDKEIGFFVDIRNLNGDILYYPFGLGRVKVFAGYHNEKLLNDNLWLITLMMDDGKLTKQNPFAIKLANYTFGKPNNRFKDKVEKESLIKRIFEETGHTKRDAKNEANALQRLMGDLYTEIDERFVFELLQNADDQPNKGCDVSINLKLLKDNLLFMHNGKPFDVADVESICSIGDSTKKNDAQKIGYKGIGFKSVFSISDTVYINSGNFSFSFDKGSWWYRKLDNIDEIPWQIKPIWAEQYRYPKSIQETEEFFNEKVSIGLSLEDAEVSVYRSMIPKLLGEPRFMLFLRNVSSLKFEDDFGEKYSIEKISNDGSCDILFNGNNVGQWITEDFIVDVDVPEETRAAIRDSKLVPQKLKDIQKTRISYAVTYKNNQIILLSKEQSILFSYLPTKVSEFAFPFIVNADFLTSANREGIHLKNPWNIFLFGCLGKLCVDFAIKLSKKATNYLEILPPLLIAEENSSRTELINAFNDSYKKALIESSFILNQSGILTKQEMIVLDSTGLSEIIGANIFCSLIETEKFLPVQYLVDYLLNNQLFELIETINIETLIDKIQNSSLINEWLITADEEDRMKFYNWILRYKEGCSAIINSLPIFSFEERLLSIKEIENNKDYIVLNEKNEKIKDVLEKLGFICSMEKLEEHVLLDCINLSSDETLFDDISERLSINNLSSEEKKRLFFTLLEFENVGEQKLKKISLFSNIKGEPAPLCDMMSYRDDALEWLHPYIISLDENFEEISKYLIRSEDEFSKVIWPHMGESGMDLIDFYRNYKWTDEQYTNSLISDYRNTDKYESLLPIVEDASKDVKIEYLSKIKSIDLAPDQKYGKESFVYRVLLMALSVYDKPTDFSSKLFYKGKCIKEFTTKDEVVCVYKQENEEEKRLTMSLMKLLPLSKSNSGEIEAIKSLFENKRSIDKFFEATSKPLPEIYSELLKQLSIPEREYPEWNIRSTAQQYLFVVYYRRRYKGWFNSYIPSIKLSYQTESFIEELMTILYENNVDVNDSPFTYKLKKEFNNKYFGKDYLLESEALDQSVQNWANNDKKKQYLLRNGVIPSSDLTLRIRQLFVANENIDESEFYLAIQQNSKAFLEYITQSGVIKFPIESENQKAVIKLIKKVLDKERVRIITSRVNLLELENNSEEWDSAQYKSWIEDHYPMIYIFPNLIPKDLVFNDIVIMNYYDGNYHYEKNNKKLYITGKNKIDDTLFEIAKEGKTDFNIEDYQITCREGKVLLSKKTIEDYELKITDLQSERDELKREIDILREQVEGSSSSSHTTIIKKGIPDALSKLDKSEAQLEAQRFLMKEMSYWEFPKDYGESDEQGNPNHLSLAYAIDQNGTKISFVLKSYKKKDEPFRINTNEWDYMMKDGAKLFVYTGSDIVNINPKDLIMNQTNVTISFSTANLDIEKRISEFADSLHYFKELHFDFESFNISARAQSIIEINNRTSGNQIIPDDENDAL